MKLAEALAVNTGDIVAFVGAGGKTHAMFRLADELTGQGWRVITTTTTRIAQDELRFAPQCVGFGHGMHLPETFPHQLEQHRHIFVFTKLESGEKVRGVRPTWLDENLALAPYLDILLVEADGSRRLPLKAPLPHEPAMPASATVVVPVVGLDVLDHPLDENHVYGADLIHNTLGHPLGSPVTLPLVAAVLMHPKLGLKGVPRGARIMPLLNKVTPENLPLARQIASCLLTDLNIERVLIAAVQENDPVLEKRRRVAAVVLAAGEAERMGEPKLLLPWDGDKTIIQRVVEQLAGCDLFEIVVVAGRWQAEIAARLVDLPARVVFNPRYAEGGMLSSLQVGLGEIWHTSDACLVVLGDQPFIERAVIERELQAFAEGRGRIVAPSYQNRRGHPLVIDRLFWQPMLDLPQDAAPRDLIRANEREIYHLVVENDSVVRDIDSSDDYCRARNQT